MKEKTFEELITDAKDKYVQEHFTKHENWKTFQHYFASRHPEWFEQIFNIIMEQFGKQVREATKREVVNINNEVILFNMGVDLESDVEFRDANAEILNLPTDRIKLTKNK